MQSQGWGPGWKRCETVHATTSMQQQCWQVQRTNNACTQTGAKQSWNEVFSHIENILRMGNISWILITPPRAAETVLQQMQYCKALLWCCLHKLPAATCAMLRAPARENSSLGICCLLLLVVLVPTVPASQAGPNPLA